MPLVNEDNMHDVMHKLTEALMRIEELEAAVKHLEACRDLVTDILEGVNSTLHVLCLGVQE
jgi:hypothetical protein